MTVLDKIEKTMEEDHESSIENRSLFWIAQEIKKIIMADKAIIRNDENDPGSLQNLELYNEILKNVHWAWPYKMSADILFEIIKFADDEKKFDKEMLNWFDVETVSMLVWETYLLLKKHHRIMLEQAYNSYLRGDYAITNNALLSIIDNTLSIYLSNKGQTSRIGIIEPIIEYYEYFSIRDTYKFLFELKMMSNNVDFIFINYNFDKDISIETNKKIRRHTSVHGVRYSNRRIDAIMLFNLLFAILKQNDRLMIFRNSVQYPSAENNKKEDKKSNSAEKKRKRFILSDKFMQKRREKMAYDFIEKIISTDKKVTHKELTEYLQKVFFMRGYETKAGNIVSKMLQKMKRQGKIKKEIDNNQIYWCLIEETV